jgi:alkyl hydroperoxide reductase subunit AhpF
MGSRLDIYVDQACPGCAYAQELAVLVRQELPELEVRIFDLALPNIQKPPSVFAVPTYLLNGKTLSLGNPDIRDLVAKIENGIFDT